MPENYLFPPAPPASLAIVGASARIPVRRVYCVGRNYAEHAREMGAKPEREPPFFFCKPSDAASVLAIDDASHVTPLPYPSATADYQHEVELVVVLGQRARASAVVSNTAQAGELVLGYAVGLDMTRRDLQTAAKHKGLPWEAGKSFDFAAPIGPVTLAPPANGETAPAAWADASVTLLVNGRQRQHGRIADMIWSVPEVIMQLSLLVRLMPGDVIMTGTPAGVAAVQRGDTLVAQVQGLSPIQLCVV